MHVCECYPLATKRPVFFKGMGMITFSNAFTDCLKTPAMMMIK